MAAGNPLAQLYEQAFRYIEGAVQADEQNNVGGALVFYTEAVNLFFELLQQEDRPRERFVIEANLPQYIQRIEALRAIVTRPVAPVAPPVDPLAIIRSRADFCLEQAMTEEENANLPGALNLYLEAGELYSSVRNQLPKTSPELPLVSKRFAEVLQQAEHVNNSIRMMANAAANKPTPSAPPEFDFPDVPSAAPVPSPSTPAAPPPAGKPSPGARPPTARPGPPPPGAGAGVPPAPGVTGGGNLTKKEKDILRTTSTINRVLCLPWNSVDLGENFNVPAPFQDPDGLLALSPKQREHFGGWRRPSEFTQGAAPCMIALISAFSIKQTVITDCSFVASLAVAAAYEKRWKKQLITGCIFPQNRRHEPMVNPSGKYMVKLVLNGVPRKVIVDDQLPTNSYGDLMCSYSSNRSELWVSLIEKAFLKVHGGYDFPGSNSTVDLHILTGWIPERLCMDSSVEPFDPERTWTRMLNGQKNGDCLITVATGEMEQAKADLLGLVPSHAYAVLDVKEVLGKRLLLVKNPWSHLGWKGTFSQFDKQSWTPALQKALNYDIAQAATIDNGVFWIDYASLRVAFSRVYLSWNPALFRFHTVLHDVYTKDGPINDRYNCGYNPQYVLTVNNDGPKSAPVWVLLSRHVTVKDEASEDYLAMHVYNSTEGKRVYYPHDALMQGTYVNGPHFLVRLDVPAGRHVFTLVASQLRREHVLYFTLNVYSAARFALAPVSDPYKHEIKVQGQWTEATAGGSMNERVSFKNNPQYALTTTQETAVILKLECPVKYSGNVVVLRAGGQRVEAVYVDTIVASTESYRAGFCYVEAVLPAGTFTVVPSTFQPGQLGSFFLTVGSASPVTITGATQQPGGGGGAGGAGTDAGAPSAPPAN